MRACRKYLLTTLSSKVSASLSSSTTLGSAGRMGRLRALGNLGCHMLAHQASHREDAGATVTARAGGPAHLGQGARTGVDGRRDGRVVDHVAVTDDHGIPF